MDKPIDPCRPVSGAGAARHRLRDPKLANVPDHSMTDGMYPCAMKVGCKAKRIRPATAR